MSKDCTIKIWDCTTGEISTVVDDNEAKPITSLCVYDGGKSFITGDEGGDISHWDLSGNKIYSFKATKSHQMQVSPCGNLLYSLSGTRRKILIIELSRKEGIELICEDSQIVNFDINKLGDRMAVALSSHIPKIHIWDLTNSKIIKTLTGHFQSIFTFMNR